MRLQRYARVPLAWWAAAVWGLGFAPPTAAQSAPPAGSESSTAVANEQAARTLFERAVSALATGRAVEGHDLLLQSLKLHPTIPARYNLAISLGEIGQPLEAIDVLDGLLAGDHGELNATQREASRDARTSLARDVARLDVRVTGVDAATISIDETEVGETRGREGVSIEVNPGPHEVQAAANEGVARTEVEVDRGGQRRVELNVVVSRTPSEPNSPLAASLRAPPKDESSVPTWAWVTGVAAVGAATLLTVLLMATRGERVADPVPGDTDNVIETLVGP